MNKEPIIIDGIECFSPSLAFKNDGFDKDSFDKLYQMEVKNFWFRSRNELIKFLVKKFYRKKTSNNFLEIGCGTGFVLRGLSSLQDFKLAGSEIYIQGIRLARLRNPGLHFIQMDAREMPFSNEFDGIGAFDVLEHIKEDERVIMNVHKALKPGGKFFVTVPQYQFMWSQLDTYAHHQRRYSREDLHRKLHSAGFKIVFSSSFVFLLFPAMVTSRIFKKNSAKISAEFDIPGFVNLIFYFLTTIDLLLIKMGLRLPFGGSLVCVAVKT